MHRIPPSGAKAVQFARQANLSGSTKLVNGLVDALDLRCCGRWLVLIVVLPH
jgi:hypothetical protein